MRPPIVLSLGGSVLAPGGRIDVRYLRRLSAFLRRTARRRMVIIIVGGGRPARQAIADARLAGVRRNRDLDWIGIRTTQLHAEIVRASVQAEQPVVADYRRVKSRGRGFVIAGGDQPGATTDFGAVRLAIAVGARMIINVTNVDGVFTADPRKVRSARLIASLHWTTFLHRFSVRMRPGVHTPFDPRAARLAARRRLTVAIVSSALSNLGRVIDGRTFRGTTIGPT